MIISLVLDLAFFAPNSKTEMCGNSWSVETWVVAAVQHEYVYASQKSHFWSREGRLQRSTITIFSVYRRTSTINNEPKASRHITACSGQSVFVLDTRNKKPIAWEADGKCGWISLCRNLLETFLEFNTFGCVIFPVTSQCCWIVCSAFLSDAVKCGRMISAKDKKRIKKRLEQIEQNEDEFRSYYDKCIKECQKRIKKLTKQRDGILRDTEQASVDDAHWYRVRQGETSVFAALFLLG